MSLAELDAMQEKHISKIPCNMYKRKPLINQATHTHTNILISSPSSNYVYDTIPNGDTGSFPANGEIPAHYHGLPSCHSVNCFEHVHHRVVVGRRHYLLSEHSWRVRVITTNQIGTTRTIRSLRTTTTTTTTLMQTNF